jgi:phage shock protein E
MNAFYPPAGEQTVMNTHHRQLVEQGALLLDVRTPEEFACGHVLRAQNIPVQELPQRLHEVGSTTRPVVVYCRSGGRSAMARQILERAGYQVRDIGPMTAW